MNRYWNEYQKAIADDRFFYERSCIRQTFFPGSETAFLKIMKEELGKDVIDDFRRLLCEYCEHVFSMGSDPMEKNANEPELWIEPTDLTLELAEELRQLEPFGEGNREPVFGLKGVFFADVKPLGMDGKHLSVTLRGSGLRAVWWGHGDLVEKLRTESAAPHDITFTLAVSDYGERHAELRLVSIA